MYYFVASKHIRGLSHWSLRLLMPGLPRVVLMVRAQVLSSSDGLLFRMELLKQKQPERVKAQVSRPPNTIRALELQASWSASQKPNLRCLHNTGIWNVDTTACSEGIPIWVDSTEQDGNYSKKIPPKSFQTFPPQCYHNKHDASFVIFLGQMYYSEGTDFGQWVTRASTEFSSPLNYLMFDHGKVIPPRITWEMREPSLHTVKMLHTRTLARAKQPFQQDFTLPL